MNACPAVVTGFVLKNDNGRGGNGVIREGRQRWSWSPPLHFLKMNAPDQGRPGAFGVCEGGR